MAAVGYPTDLPQSDPQSRCDVPIPQPHDLLVADLDRRLAGLPALTRRVLLSSAAAGAEAPLGVVLAAAGAQPRDCQPAEDERLIYVVAHRIAFADRLVRRAAYESATVAERREMHLALAAHVDEAQRARHKASAAELAGAPFTRLLDAASESAAQTGDLAGAATQLARAAEHTADRHRARHRWVRAARFAALAGNPERAQALLDRADVNAADRPELVRVYASVVPHVFPTGDERATGHIDALTVLVRNGRIDPQAAVDLLWAGILTATAGGRRADRTALGRLLGAVRPIIDRPEREPGNPVRAALLGCAATIADGTPPDAATMDAGRECSEQVGRDGDLARGARGVQAWAVGDWVTSTRLLRRVSGGGPSVLNHPLLTVLLVDSLIQCGLWVEAERLLAESQPRPDARPSLYAAAVTAAGGLLSDLRDGGHHFAVQAPDQAAGPLVDCLLGEANGRRATWRDDPGRAFAAYRRLFDADGIPIHFVLSLRGLPGLVRSARSADERAEAQRVLAATRSETGLAGPGGLRILIDWAETLLQPAPLGVPRLPALADQLRELSRPYDQAVAMLDHSDRLRAERRLIESRPCLRATAGIFGRLGAHADVRLVRARLRATGVLGSSGPSTAFDTLTAQQQHIAQLAALGLTNKDIAARLRLSPRTVGSHLYQIYPALGVVGRRQLADVVPPTR